MGNRLWMCPKCKTIQDPDEIRTVEIVEPGKNPRVEFHGKIRAEFLTMFNRIVYHCLVCGHTFGPPDPEDPTPGGASVTFLHPITEEDDECCGGNDFCERDAC